MSLPRTITVPLWSYLFIVACLAVSTVSHLFHLAVGFIR